MKNESFVKYMYLNKYLVNKFLNIQSEILFIVHLYVYVYLYYRRVRSSVKF